MSRIQYAISEPDGLEKLHKAVIQTLNKLLKQAVKTANNARQGSETPVEQMTLEDILEIVFVGNTTMHHLLLNIPPDHLGKRTVRADYPQGGGCEGARAGTGYQPFGECTCAADHRQFHRRGHERRADRRGTLQSG